MPDRVGSILNDPITTHMRTDPTRLRSGQTVAEALAAVRASPPGGRIIYFYVVDANDRLKGVVPTRRLLLSPPDAVIDKVMVKRVIGVPHTATVLDACEFFTLHKLLAFPVVDEHRRLVGLVDVELYTGELADTGEDEPDTTRDDLFQLIGVHLTAAEQKSVGPAFRRRFPWLLCNVAGGLLAGVLTDIYSDVSTLAIVTPFIPVVLAVAESVAIQSVTLALQLLHGTRPTWGLLPKAAGREAVVGLLLGLGCGLIVGVIAVGWMGTLWVGLSLFLGMAGGVTVAAAVGLSLPVVLKLLKRDPSIASGPIALAAADMAALIVFFNLARLMMA
jgi:magnesium transporter